MKCPKNNKFCSCSLIIKAKGDNFICSGINSKPSEYDKDIIKLCLNGKIDKREIEMTRGEAGYICSALAASLRATDK